MNELSSRNETKDGTKVRGPVQEIAGTKLDKTLEKDQSKHRVCAIFGTLRWVFYSQKTDITKPTSTREWVDNDLQEHDEREEDSPANIINSM